MSEPGSNDTTFVTKVNVDDIGSAQGLLWAYNSLFVVVNNRDTEKSGLYRLEDSNGDGQLDKSTFLKVLI